MQIQKHRIIFTITRNYSDQMLDYIFSFILIYQHSNFKPRYISNNY